MDRANHPQKGRPVCLPAVLRLVAALAFLSLTLFPLSRLLFSITPQNFTAVVGSPSFWNAAGNSLYTTLISTVITVALALAVSLALQRTAIRGKHLLSALLGLPMLIPSISIGMGLVILLGNNGLLGKLWGLSGTVYGPQGIILGSVIYAFPLSLLMTSDIIRYEDASPYEAAQVMGIPRHRQLLAITVPYLQKPLLRVFFAVFTLIITDYGVPLMVGGRYITLPVVIYQEVIGQLDFGKGAVYGVFLLLPAVAAFLADTLCGDVNPPGSVIRAHTPRGGRGGKAAASLLCATVAGIITLPVLSFLLLSFTGGYPYAPHFTLNNLQKTLQLHAGRYLLHSLAIALAVSLLGTWAAFLAAYLSTRVKARFSGLLHLSVIASAAIPGVVLGLSYVLAFRRAPFYGGLWILVMVNLGHFFSSPYFMICSTLSKQSENLEAVAETLQISRFSMVKDILIPQCRGSLLEMISYFFVNCMMTISAVSFLASAANKPVSLMINQFEAQAQLECASVVSLMILTVNLLMKLGISLAKRRY